MTDDRQGLSSSEAASLLAHEGANELERGRPRSLAGMFFSQFKDILIIILAFSTCFSLAVGEYVEAVSIIAIMLLNAIMGFVQEFRTERSLAALAALSAPMATLVRDGRVKRIPAREVVVGDLAVLKAGDRIPADIELTQSVAFECDEAMLTGESRAIAKKRGELCYMGCSAVAGRAEGIVVKTGMNTEMGRIAGLLGTIGEQKTPLQKRLASLGKVIAIACVSVCALVAAVGVIRGLSPLDMVLTGLSLAVAAIPEGLPAVVTAVLAMSVGRILKKGAVIRKLHAVETLGCASVICCDKTGTITQNKMTARVLFAGDELFVLNGAKLIKNNRISDVSDNLRELMSAALIASSPVNVRIKGRGLTADGSPTESAIAIAAYRIGVTRSLALKELELNDELPFDSVRKYMSVTVRGKGGARTLIKGAPDRVELMCAMSDAQRQKLRERVALLAAEGFRVIGVAEKVAGKGRFLGLIGIDDPPRPEVAPAVKLCKKAGIRVIMITGDHERTAAAVAAKVGVDARSVVSGSQLDKISDEELRALVAKTGVFARVSPEHKLRIVRALKANGEIAAMTGDGVNDAPAVKEADIGVAMGVAGSDVTKEAAAVVVSDDNFATIVAAVTEGRIIYRNIKSFIGYLLTCNLGEVLTVVIAMLMGLPAVFAPIQLLLINLITDGLPAIALGMESGEQDVMSVPPRPANEGIFAGGLWLSTLVRGAVLALFNVLCFVLTLKISGNAVIASSAAYIALVLSQMLFVLEKKLLRGGLFANPALLGSVAFSIAATLLSVYLPPLQLIFGTCAITGKPLLICVLCTLASAIFGALIGRFMPVRR